MQQEARMLASPQRWVHGFMWQLPAQTAGSTNQPDARNRKHLPTDGSGTVSSRAAASGRHAPLLPSQSSIPPGSVSTPSSLKPVALQA
jgi:hypothetical protein